MAMQIITLAILILTCAVGIWKWVARMKSERRRLADEARAKLDKANSPDGNASDFLDAFDNAHRMR